MQVMFDTVELVQKIAVYYSTASMVLKYYRLLGILVVIIFASKVVVFALII